MKQNETNPLSIAEMTMPSELGKKAAHPWPITSLVDACLEDSLQVTNFFDEEVLRCKTLNQAVKQGVSYGRKALLLLTYIKFLSQNESLVHLWKNKKINEEGKTLILKQCFRMLLLYKGIEQLLDDGRVVKLYERFIRNTTPVKDITDKDIEGFKVILNSEIFNNTVRQTLLEKLIPLEQ